MFNLNCFLDKSSLFDWYTQINLLDLDSSPHFGDQSISKSTSAWQGEGVKINYFEHQKFNLYVIQINSLCKRNTCLFIYRTIIILLLTKWVWFKTKCRVIMQSGTYIKLFNCFEFTSKDFFHWPPCLLFWQCREDVLNQKRKSEILLDN